MLVKTYGNTFFIEGKKMLSQLRAFFGAKMAENNYYRSTSNKKKNPKFPIFPYDRSYNTKLKALLMLIGDKIFLNDFSRAFYT